MRLQGAERDRQTCLPPEPALGGQASAGAGSPRAGRAASNRSWARKSFRWPGLHGLTEFVTRRSLIVTAEPLEADHIAFGNRRSLMVLRRERHRSEGHSPAAPRQAKAGPSGRLLIKAARLKAHRSAAPSVSCIRGEGLPRPRYRRQRDGHRGARAIQQRAKWAASAPLRGQLAVQSYARAPRQAVTATQPQERITGAAPGAGAGATGFAAVGTAGPSR